MKNKWDKTKLVSHLEGAKKNREEERRGEKEEKKKRRKVWKLGICMDAMGFWTFVWI